ncbi:MAG: ParB N-terminal domain-containing protein [Candidatus Sulfotelmatobacter sp.]
MNTQTVAPTTTTQPSLNPRHRFHPLVEIFPEMEKHVFAEFIADVKVNGVREPITVYKNQIIDGRSRWLACEVLGITCPQRVYEGKENESDLLAFVLSKNLHRRHLNTSQRAMLAAKIADMTHGGDRKSDQAGKSQLDSVGRPSRTDAAKLLNVSPESVTTAKKVIATGSPEIVKAVEQGRLAVSAAAKIADHPPAVQRQAVASIDQGSKGATVVRALPTASGKAKPTAPAQAKPSKEQREAMDAAPEVWESLIYLEDGWQEDHDGKALWDFAPHFFWPLLDADQQGDVVHIAKLLMPWLEGIIAQAKKTPGAIVAKPKLVTDRTPQ